MRAGAPRLARCQPTGPQSNQWTWGRRQVFGLKGAEELPSTYFASLPSGTSLGACGAVVPYNRCGAVPEWPEGVTGFPF